MYTCSRSSLIAKIACKRQCNKFWLKGSVRINKLSLMSRRIGKLFLVYHFCVREGSHIALLHVNQLLPDVTKRKSEQYGKVIGISVRPPNFGRSLFGITHQFKLRLVKISKRDQRRILTLSHPFCAEIWTFANRWQEKIGQIY